MARDEDLAEQIGKDMYFDLVDHDNVSSFRVQNQTSFTFSRYHHQLHYANGKLKKTESC